MRFTLQLFNEQLSFLNRHDINWLNNVVLISRGLETSFGGLIIRVIHRKTSGHFKQAKRILMSINNKVFENFTFSFESNCNSKKWIIWFIMGSPAKFQHPNPSITASNCIPRFWSFGRFVWKSKKLRNFFIFEKLFTFLFWISWFGYLRVRHVEFSSKLFLVWK